jgi:hypothetical protein
MNLKDLAMTYCAYRIPLGAAILVFAALGLALDLTPSYIKNTYNKANDALVSFLCVITMCAVAAVMLRASPVLCGLTVGTDVWTLASTPLFV